MAPEHTFEIPCAKLVPARATGGINEADITQFRDQANASLRAAFMAAAQKTSIGMVHLERAARLEYERSGQIATASQHGP